jgi:two-component system, response regulator PdtaR
LAVVAASGLCFPTVLVVEDDFLVRITVVQYLQEHGCTVLEAETAERAIVMCGSTTPIDILFTDINLDGSISGWDIAEAFRAARPGTAVVYTSGNGADRSRCVSRSQFFGKPYRLPDILEACQYPPMTYSRFT